MSAAVEKTELPGFVKLAWMLFMQPITLSRIFRDQGLGTDPSWRKVRGSGDPARQLFRRGWIVVNVAMLAIFLMSMAWLDLPGIVLWITFFALINVAVITTGIGRSVPLIGVFFVFQLYRLHLSFNSPLIMALMFVSFAITFQSLWLMLLGAKNGYKSMFILWFIVNIISAILFLYIRNSKSEYVFFLALFSVVFSGSYLFVLECVVVLLARYGLSERWLPYRHHDTIFFPLLGLRDVLVRVGTKDPSLGQQLITEATNTLAQQRPARLALIELQARSLERAARDRLWAKAKRLDLDFLPGIEKLELGSPFRIFAAAAGELHAAELSGSHSHEQRALERAEKALRGDLFQTLGGRRLDEDLDRRLSPVMNLWISVVEEQRARLEERMKESPQVPTPFVAGPVLGPEDEHLFKGRLDLVRLIDHDLLGDQRAPIVLTGQRRTGKSSLLRILPAHLGGGTKVVLLNFQELSGRKDRGQVHLWLAKEVRAAVPGASLPPEEPEWGPTLRWLKEVDAHLEGRGERVLIAIDEIERLNKGFEDGWAHPEILDLFRAMGDSLRQIRLLLVSAHSLPRLGHDWVDRLISVIVREIGYLSDEDALELIERPIPDFPPIYPEGGPEEILDQTNGHPYLIQLICDELCRILNEKGALKASEADLQKAIDQAFTKTHLFDELWAQRDDEERGWLVELADEPRAVRSPDAALRRLLKEHYVERSEEDRTMHIAVPLFAEGIREDQGG